MKYKISFYDTTNRQIRYCGHIFWNHHLDNLARAEGFNNYDLQTAAIFNLTEYRYFIKSVKKHYPNRFQHIKLIYEDII